jgi:predicted nucleic acid-binding protein
VANAVIDTSALIALARLHLLDLLPQVFDEALVPEAVVSEALPASEDAPGAAVVQSALRDGKLLVRQVSSPSDQPAWSGSLGRGEVEVIQLALEADADFVVLDDLAARRIADGLGLRVIGTVGVLMLARRTGQLSSIMPLVERLRDLGFRLSDDVVDAMRSDDET